MSKQFCLSAFLVAAILTGPAVAQSIVPIDPATVTDGHVYLMENVGADLPDDSANSNNGTLVGSPQVVPGINGSALKFNGTSDGAALPDAATINTSTHQNKTVIAVFNCADVSKTEKQIVFEEGGSTRGMNIYVHQGLAYAGAWNRGDYTPDFPGTWLSAPIGSNEWHVVAGVLRGGTAGQADDKFEMWMDGKLIAKGPGGELRSRSDDNGIANVQQQTRVHNAEVLDAGNWFEGMIDEVWILNTALSEAELSAIAFSRHVAVDPVPDKSAADVVRDVVLAWGAGEFAATHDVYLGTVFADVNDASRADPKSVLVSQDQTATEFEPAGLEYGQTYYWRVDEVNVAPDSTIYQGDVWSFTVEPYAYPVQPVAATAANAQAGMGPENTINGIGLNAADEHSTLETEMWLSDGTGANWIQYEFDKAYKLDELWVWNSNQLIEAFLGFGAKDVTIEYSADGETWTTVENVPEFAQATAAPAYTANTMIDLNGITAKFVKLTINSNWGGMAPQTGLSEVRFLAVPLQARAPMPADDATDVALDTELNWRPGREATSHQVFFDTDANAVADGVVAGETVTDHSYAPAALNLGTTYYWKVDEAGDAGTHPGNLWSFTTQEYMAVDDFEAYNDDDNRIYESWVDGVTDGQSGSTVGYFQAPFAEMTIVHSDKQSMPLAYDNTSFGFSETTLTFDSPQDWTAYGIKSLAIHFAGAAGNGGQLYAKINNAKVLFDGDPADLARPTWQAWNIDLSKVSGIGSVRSLTIGIEGAGATGTLYLDDIRLYPKTPEYITPVPPADTDLVAYYTFDEGAGTKVGDSSGNGHDGTVTGAPQWVAGKIGGAMAFNGSTSDYVEAPEDPAVTGTNSRTAAAWIKTTTYGEIVSWGDNVAGQKWIFRVQESNGTLGAIRIEVNGGYQVGSTDVRDDEWHHVAAVLADDGSPDAVEIELYVDGVLEANSAQLDEPIDTAAGVVRIGLSPWHSRPFTGLIDDVRIYSRPLSAAEVAGLAGRTIPLHKPF